MPGKGDGEVLLEYRRIGQYLKVMAIDAETGTEVSVAGPVANGARAYLARVAVAKLRYVMRRNAGRKTDGTREPQAGAAPPKARIRYDV